MQTNTISGAAKNVVGMCLFLGYDDARLLEIINGVSGWGLTPVEYNQIAERGLTLARLFNIREGFGPADDVLPPQVTRPHVSGPLSRVSLDTGALRAQVLDYYKARAWGEDGVPLPETIDRLGLGEYALTAN